MAQLRCCRLQKAFLETPSESQTTIFSLRQLSGLLYVHLYNCLTNVHLPHQPGSSGRVGLGLPCTVIHLLNKCFEQINEQALISRVLPVLLHAVLCPNSSSHCSSHSPPIQLLLLLCPHLIHLPLSPPPVKTLPTQRLCPSIPFSHTLMLTNPSLSQSLTGLF